ncbi:WAT1-related protein At1g44800 isoform X1 [Amborella trichopoda]|uniref:WAT1-related protein n=1 Tax=Amborella trichopoda TaxID=13333 RepID=U5DCW4_AMBTC|nr:WAT1-related protein At1g44800 isoform X1 [Amborella trichopoda]ERN18253.1 hypothetical protein AMTR_s00055p00114700 [Amborella trichopoda]|eukprot:XP_006856786.1 WAT1-related protein At1g44800 isoform X1 [Amborella trichopoda]
MEDLIPVVAQVMVQFFLTGMYLMTKVAYAEGMSPYVFVTYRSITATLFLAPFACFLESDKRPPLNLKAATGIFLLSILGIAINQNCYFGALYYTSSTFVSTIANLIPAITFVMALILRLERFDIKTIKGKAKVLGTVTCVAGAMIMTLAKGPAIKIFHHLKTNNSVLLLFGASKSPESNWVLGPILIFGSVLAWSAWINYQAWAFRSYPAPLSLTALMCFMGIFPTAVIALLLDDVTAWRLNFDIKLVCYIYSGVLCTAFQFFIQSWCIKRKGPIFASSFFPVCTVIVAILEPLFFPVDIYIASVIGIALVIAGLYCVLWGKAMDVKIGGGGREDQVGTRLSQGQDEEACLSVSLKEPLLK